MANLFHKLRFWRSDLAIWILLVLAAVYKLPDMLQWFRVNELGLELARHVVNRSMLDLWNAPEAMSSYRLEHSHLETGCAQVAQVRSGAYLQGICKWVTGEPDSALIELALAQSERPLLAAMLIGRIYDYKGDSAKALAVWKSVGMLTELDGLAQAWRAQGHFKTAADLYEALLADQPDDVKRQLTLASVYVDMRDYAQARVVLDNLLVRHPGDIDALALSMYVLAFGEGHYQDALQAGERLLQRPELSPEQQAGLYWILGTIERQAGNLSAAVDYFARYRDTGGTAKWKGNFAIAQTYRVAGRLSDASNFIALAVAEAPTQPIVLTEQGLIRVQSDQVELGLRDLQQTIQSRPGDVGLLIYIAVELRQLGQDVAACQMFKNALLLDRTNATATNAIAACP